MKRVIFTMMIMVLAWSLHAGKSLFIAGGMSQVPGSITINAQVVPVSIPGGSDGAIDISVSGGVSPYNYLWSNGASSEDIAGLTAGLYSVTVTDAIMNAATGSWLVTEPGPLNVTATVVPVTCNGMSDGSVDLTVSGGVVPYSYYWSNGSSSEDIGFLPAGSYAVTVTDATLLTVSGTWNVTEPVLLTADAVITPVSCFGGDNGSIDITVEGGTAPYTYFWSNGASSEDVYQLEIGNYSVVVTDIQGCALSQNFMVMQPDLLIVTVNQVVRTCPGISAGAIDISVQGGVAPYSFLWSNGTTAEDIQGVLPGIYTVMVMDSFICTETQTIAIEPFPQPIATIIPSGPATFCQGSSVTLTAGGGIAYLWSTGATTPTITVNTSGTYAVTVTDINGCTDTESIPIMVHPLPVASILPGGPLSFCQGGLVVLTASGGTAYHWSTGATTPSITCSTGGVYSVTVTNPAGCTDTESVEVIVYPVPNAVITPGGPTTFCSGGSVLLTASGGSSYAWSSGATSQAITVASSGTFTVTVTNQHGCSDTESISVTANQAPTAVITAGGPTTFCQGGSVTLTASGGATFLWSNGSTTSAIVVTASGTYTVTVTSNAGCHDTESVTTTVHPVPVAVITPNGPTTFCQGGSVTLAASGGVSYAWSTGSTSSSIAVTASGNYTVTATNSYGCKDTESKTVTVNPLPVVTVTAGGPTTFCQGGSVTLTAAGGNSYVWSTGSTMAAITVTATGNYTVTATNSNGCSNTKSTSVTVNPMPVATITPSGPTTFCQGGSVTLTASGGVSYSWSNGATSSSISVTNGGTYTVTVTNSHGCTDTEPATVTVVPNPVAVITPGGPVTFCQGGSVTLTASGGGTYKWSTGPSTASITVSASGSYTVTVTNASGCKDTESVNVTVNPLPVAVITPGGPTTFCQGGSVTLTASGGATYQWSTGSSAQSITATATGTYTVTVTSAVGCTDTESATVSVNPNPVAAITPGGPTIFCQGGSVTLTASGGTTYKWSSGPTTPSITVSSSGSYTVTATNTNGCSDTASRLVTVNPLPVAVITPSGPTTFCQGGSVILTASGGTSYLWSTGSSTPTITVNNSATYTVTVTNAQGCKDTESVTTSVQALPVAAITAGGPTTFCQGGSVTLTASGGSTYLWSNGSTNTQISVSNSGTYTVTVTNSFGCTDTESTAIVVNPLPVPVITPGGPTTFCQGGSVTLTASGGSAYAWSNGNTGTSITVNSGGTFTVTVTNSQGCSATKSSVITVNPLPVATITPGGPTTFCQGGSVVLTASGGTSYAWSTGATGAAITVNSAGTYVVTVTNVNACSNSQSVSVAVLPLPSATITANGPTTFCQGGSVTLTATGGATYVWSNGATGQSITVSNAGNYSVTPTSSQGCQGTPATQTITVTPTPSVSNGQPSPVCSGAAFTLALTSGVPGTTFTWTASCSPAGSVTGYTPLQASPVLMINDLPVNNTSGFATVTYLVTPSANGCSGPAKFITVVVKPTPFMATPSPSPVCSGSIYHQTLTASIPGSKFTWSAASTPTGSVAGYTALQTVPVTAIHDLLVNMSGSAASVAYQVVPIANGCTGPAGMLNVPVNPIPVLTSPDPDPVCSGELFHVDLTASQPGATFTWTASCNPPAAVTGFTSVQTTPVTAINDILTNLTNTPATVTYHITPVSGGCAGIPTDLTVTVKPTPSLSITSPTAICSGSAFMQQLISTIPGTTCTWTATCIPAGAVTGFTALQTSPVTQINDLLLNQTNAAATVTYHVTPVADGCSGITTDIAVTVYPEPVSTTQPPAPVCSGSLLNIPLTANIPGTLFTWSAVSYPPGSITGFTAIQTTPVNLISDLVNNLTSNYGMVVYEITPVVNGCSGPTEEILVLVRPVPVLSMPAPVQVCSGNYFTQPLSSPVAGTSFTWSAACNPPGSVTGFTAMQTIPVTAINDLLTNITGSPATVTYHIIPHSNGCTGPAADLTVTVKHFPDVTITPSGPTTFCQGGSVTLTASGGVSYLWSNGAATAAVFVNTSGVYSVTVTDAYGCTASTSATVTVLPLLPVAISIVADANPVYAGTSVTFTATTVNGGLTPVYQWKVNNVNSGINAAVFSYIPVNGDAVVCQVTSSAQCPAPVPAVSNTITMTVNPLPYIEVVSPNGGEDWVRGTAHVITWLDNVDATVDIALYKGGVFLSNIATGEASDGNYLWTIPASQTPGNDYRVRISSMAGLPVMDESNGNFTISTGINAYDTVKNVVVASGQTSCFNATNTLTVAGNGTTFQVQSGGNATLIAGQKISFLPGTRVFSGGYMHGYISNVYCGGMTAPMVSTITGTEDPQAVVTSSGYILYPNPTPGSFTIESRGTTPQGISHIEVLDMRGMVITSGTLCNNCPNNFNIGHVPSGLYFVRISAGMKTETIKLMKGARE